MRVAIGLAAVAIGIVAAASPGSASETITYTYDALGRLTSTAHTGGVNSGVQSTYSFDPAGNRTQYAVAGVRPHIVVVPNGQGYVVIPVHQ